MHPNFGIFLIDGVLLLKKSKNSILMYIAYKKLKISIILNSFSHFSNKVCIINAEKQFIRIQFLEGFEGIYTRRTNDFPDGCATFFNQNVLTLISRKDVLYNLQIPTMDRDNIGG